MGESTGLVLLALVALYAISKQQQTAAPVAAPAVAPKSNVDKLIDAGLEWWKREQAKPPAAPPQETAGPDKADGTGYYV